MKLVVMGGHVPCIHAGGATLTTWTIAHHAVAQGHEVVVIPLVTDAYIRGLGDQFDGRVAEIEGFGASVRVVRSLAGAEHSLVPKTRSARLRRIVRPEPELLFPSLLDRPAVAEALAEIGADAVIAYHWETLAALYEQGTPKLGVVVEPAHLPPLYRWRNYMRRRPSLRKLKALRTLATLARFQPRLMVDLLNDCEAPACLSFHHTQWLRDQGAERCGYLATPVPDAVGPAWRSLRDARRSAKPRVLLIGRLGGLATIEGLGVFANDTLPRLEEALGPDGFEVHIVGGDTPRGRLKRALERPSVTLVGHQDDATDEFLAADVLVVPTPIKLGTRVRIAVSFSYGCPVVAHEANGLGMPELAHDDNILFGKTGADLADGILRVLGDAAVKRRLEERAHETFTQHYAPPASVGRMLEIADSIAGSKRPTTAA